MASSSPNDPIRKIKRFVFQIYSTFALDLYPISQRKHLFKLQVKTNWFLCSDVREFTIFSGGNGCDATENVPCACNVFVPVCITLVSGMTINRLFLSTSLSLKESRILNVRSMRLLKGMQQRLLLRPHRLLLVRHQRPLLLPPPEGGLIDRFPSPWQSLHLAGSMANLRSIYANSCEIQSIIALASL